MFSGYTGIDCEKAIQPCDGNPCQNEAICLLEDDQPVCYCVPDYHGPFCELRYDDCESKMAVCENGGYCIDGINNYTCFCPAPFTGATCTEMLETTTLSIGTSLDTETSPIISQTILPDITELPEPVTEKDVVEETTNEKKLITDVEEVTLPDKKPETDVANKDFTTTKMEMDQETSISTLASPSTDTLDVTEPTLEMTTLERVSISQERIPPHVDITAATIVTNSTTDYSEPEMSAFFSPTPKSIFTTIAEQLGFSSLSIGTEKEIESSVESKTISAESDFTR